MLLITIRKFPFKITPMPKIDPRVDAKIEKSPEFARPILSHIRKLVHENCPEVVETIKWGMPCFEYKGILCSMAAFKQHCALSFWKGSAMSDPYKIFSPHGETSMGHLGKITSLADLPEDKVLGEYIREASKLNEAGVKAPSKSRKAGELKKPEVPDYFMDRLKKNKAALEHFEKFPPSQQKEYVTWITDAKTEPTREKRMATAVDWLSEGKIRHWKHVKK